MDTPVWPHTFSEPCGRQNIEIPELSHARSAVTRVRVQPSDHVDPTPKEPCPSDAPRDAAIGADSVRRQSYAWSCASTPTHGPRHLPSGKQVVLTLCSHYQCNSEPGCLFCSTTTLYSCPAVSMLCYQSALIASAMPDRMYSRSLRLWRVAWQARSAGLSAAPCRCCTSATAAEPTSKRQQKKQQQQQQQGGNAKSGSEAAITKKSEDYSRCCTCPWAELGELAVTV